MTRLQQVELGVLGPLQVRQYGLPVAIPGAKPRAILSVLGLNHGSVVASDTFVELLWGDDPPRTAVKALQTHISHLRRVLGEGFVLTEGVGWTLGPATESDATRFRTATKLGRDAMAAGDASDAVARFDEALSLWRGVPELPDTRRGVSEKTLWMEGRAALVEDRTEALLATGRAAEVIGELEAAIADAPLRERRWGQLMLALYRAGRQGEALGAYKRARALLADELGVDPGPDLRRLEAAIVSQDASLEVPVAQHLSHVMRAVTFLLTDIEGSTVAWENDADAMAIALARHDEIVEQVVTFRGGRLVKTRGEGDATFSVFDRPSAAAAAAIELQEAIRHEPWGLADAMRIRVALHTGEVEFRDGDYFGRAVNRAARLRSLAAGGQTLCSGATAELVIDSLADDVVLADLGMRQLKNLTRPEHVFELRLETDQDSRAPMAKSLVDRPELPAVLAGSGPFVGRQNELERLLIAWQATLSAGTGAVLVTGEPGVGKTRLAGEWSHRAYDDGAVVLYGRCDEDLGAPYQPFAEALRTLVRCLDANRLRGLRGIEALLPMISELAEVLPELAAAPRADPDTERYALFDAVVRLLGIASEGAPVVLILDDLHWAAKPTLLLLRHLLRFGEHARVQIVGTYRSTDVDRSHPLAATLADLNRDGSANRLTLGGLDAEDVTAYLAEAGYDDEELALALSSVTGGNPFFLIEALRHVDESDGKWDPSTLPHGVREAVSRRLSRLPVDTNKALAAAAVVGSTFSVDLVERVVGDDLLDAFDEARAAGIVIEEPGGRYRFNHALVRQSLLAELASVRRMRLHQKIAAALETEPGANDELLAELAYHYFECAWSGNAAKAAEYCRRAADQAMTRLAYEGAADLYDKAVHALEEIDGEAPDDVDQLAELLVARCEALLAAGDVASAAGAVAQLRSAARDSARLAAWGVCFDGQLSMLTDPERLDEIEAEVSAAAEELAGLDDAAGEANAHTVRAGCLARLGRIGDAETALDQALTAARRAREHRRVNAVLAGAPLAALWGPNPVPRAGGRCLDVVRLLRITTGSPVVEATSTRCQGVLDAFRGRASAGRQLIDSARRSLTELGMRHALLEVDQFAGILELVADDPVAAEGHLRRAYNGFRRMGLDADTAETAALLARACLALDRDPEADELCSESERLAGHALKAAIAWRTVRAQLLARRCDHAEARRVAEDAVAIAARTDALVDHGDACLALATVLGAAGDAAGARAAAERALGLYELKGAAALVEKAQVLVGEHQTGSVPTQFEPATELIDTALGRTIGKLVSAVGRKAWDEVALLFAPMTSVESRRKVVGFPQIALPSSEWPREIRRYLEDMQLRSFAFVSVRGERLALVRLHLGAEDPSHGAPQDDVLELVSVDEDGRVAQQIWFDVEDMAVAIAVLDAEYARLEVVVQPRAVLENVATRTSDRVYELFAEGRWDEFGALYAEVAQVEDRRRGLRWESNDRTAAIAQARAIADLGVVRISGSPIAIRGDRLCLNHVTLHSRDGLGAEAIVIMEVDANERLVVQIVFDPDDIDAAFTELDALYLAGEAAAHAHAWSVIVNSYAAFNRGEPTDVVNVDHRRVTSYEHGDLTTAIYNDVAPNLHNYVEAVHRLGDCGVVVTGVSTGTSPEGFDAEWRVVLVHTVDGDLMSRNEIYDEADLDAALTRFDELDSPLRRLNNTANQVADRLLERLAARDWDAMAHMVAADIRFSDRRRVVNATAQLGRDLFLQNFRAAADLGANQTFKPVAIRGDRLVLARARFARGDGDPDEFGLDMLHVLEIDGDERVVATVTFDVDDIDSAFAELDERYIAGEAAGFAQTWSAIVQGHAALNRREMPAGTPDWANVDHRRVAAFAPGELAGYIRAGWEVDQPTSYIEAVHRLTSAGAVATFVAHGTSRDGFDAEWRVANLFIFDGLRCTRVELFDEADLDAALAIFDEIVSPATHLENAATRAFGTMGVYFSAGDWVALAKVMAPNMVDDDRRHVVNAGLRRGRDAVLITGRAVAETGTEVLTSSPVATRGGRLALCRTTIAEGEQRPGVFSIEFLSVVEVDADEKLLAHAAFDLDDLDAAYTELDARYIAGEAASHADIWTAVVQAYAAFNRQELSPRTPDWVNVDHRRTVGSAPGEMAAYVTEAWTIAPDITTRIETVYRLSSRGALFGHRESGTAEKGFTAEWHEINLLMFDGGLISHCELYDEADLDAALARFDELNRSAPRLENAATRMHVAYNASLTIRDWHAMEKMVADDIRTDDRRRVVSGGVLQGRAAQMKSMRAAADVGVRSVESSAIATRGDRLALIRNRISGDERPEAFGLDIVTVVEVNADGRCTAGVLFDPEDLGAAFAELDSRYLAGEAAAHAQTWSAVLGAREAIYRRELPELAPDFVNVDHRRAIGVAPGDMTSYVEANLADYPSFSIHIETVFRLNGLGAVITFASTGTSQDGFDAEWRMIQLITVDGDLINRCELFDESDLAVALARFDELSAPAQRFHNAASAISDRFYTCFATRDWDTLTEMMAEDVSMEDHRRVVGAGVRRGRDAEIEDLRTLAEIGFADFRSEAVAVRGERLILTRFQAWSAGPSSEAFHTELLGIGEMNADHRVAAIVAYDPADVDAAFGELDNRYLAGEAAEYAHTWSVVAGSYAALSANEVPAMAPDCATLDHRRTTTFAPGDLPAYIRAGFDIGQHITAHVEVVHRLNHVGALVGYVAHGRSREGFHGEWREIGLSLVTDEMISRCELFEESDLDAAIARFDELTQSNMKPHLENAASRATARFDELLAVRDWVGMGTLFADGIRLDDRRRLVGVEFIGREATIANMKASADTGVKNVTTHAVAARGDRLTLQGVHINGKDQRPDAFRTEALVITEVDELGCITAFVLMDPDGVDAAFAELESRYLAGEAAPHKHVWSAITTAYAGMTRGEVPATTADLVNVDHRTVARMEPDEGIAYLRASWDLAPAFELYIEAVHRLSAIGAVFTRWSTGTSREGFDAEWRAVDLMTVEGGLINRGEIFEESDLDAALARFDELDRSAPKLENSATDMWARLADAFNRRNMGDFIALVTADGRIEDRRKGLRAVHEGNARQEGVRALFESTSPSWRMEVDAIALRGSRLSLTRERYRDTSIADSPIAVEVLTVLEVGDDGLVRETVDFDPDDVDTAFAELDNRYLAGEAAPYADTWSSIVETTAAFNRRELPPATTNSVNVDHRRGMAFGPGELTAYLRAAWDLSPQAHLYVEAVHRLSDLGAVVTHAGHATSREGFDAEWRVMNLFTFERGGISRCEVFDESDLDAALARFDELDRSP